MLFSELAKRVAEKYPEVKTAYPHGLRTEQCGAV